MLEGEGFNAALSLDNTSNKAIEVISVDIRLTIRPEFDRTNGFTILPNTPTDWGLCQLLALQQETG